MKLNKKVHITKKGKIKKNPVRKISYEERLINEYTDRIYKIEQSNERKYSDTVTDFLTRTGHKYIEDCSISELQVLLDKLERM